MAAMLMTFCTPSARRRALRAAAWCVAWALVIAIGDSSAPGRDPSHGHVVYGGTPIDRARALLEHSHGSVSPNMCLDPGAGNTVGHNGDDNEHSGHAGDVVAADGAHDSVVLSVRSPSMSVTVLGLDTGIASAAHRHAAPPEAALFPLAPYMNSHWQAPDLITPTPPPKAS